MKAIIHYNQINWEIQIVSPEMTFYRSTLKEAQKFCKEYNLEIIAYTD